MTLCGDDRREEAAVANVEYWETDYLFHRGLLALFISLSELTLVSFFSDIVINTFVLGKSFFFSF